jgi:hypothetical protein
MAFERSITVFSTLTSKKVTISSSATTWGELKNDSRISSLIGSNMEGAVRETKVSLKNDDAVLPEGAHTIFLVQAKSKAGIELNDEALAELEAHLDTLEETAQSIRDLLSGESDDSLAAEAAQFG